MLSFKFPCLHPPCVQPHLTYRVHEACKIWKGETGCGATMGDVVSVICVNDSLYSKAAVNYSMPMLNMYSDTKGAIFKN
jgi:hypothetical protein